MNQASAGPVPVSLLCRITHGLPYFSDWSIPEIKSIAASCRTVHLAAPTRIMAFNGIEPFAYFLVKGEMAVETPSGEVRTIRVGDPDAGYPIGQVRPSPYNVIAAQGSELLRIEASKLRSHQVQRKPAQLFANDEVAELEWIEHPLVNRLLQQFQNGRLALPAMPGIAVRLRKALDDDDYCMEQVVTIMSADPAIVARLLKVANSALFRGYQPCSSVKTGLMRLGVNKAQQIVMSLATRDLFVVGDLKLKTLMLQRWRHAIDIAALCAVLAKLTPGLQSETALLVGLLHEIGSLPLLRAAAAYPDLLEKPDTLQEMLTRLTPELSGLALREWGIGEDYVRAAQHQNNWFREHDEAADYTDVLIIAHLHALVGQRAELKLPRIDEVPAFHKLALGNLTPSLSLSVLDEAKAHIQELKTLLA
ncbi:MAG: HDOD domain-containing protein [Ketobacter sp.]|nr:MAG: HDOD domain-containing protein [Ketobacter sp.]